MGHTRLGVASKDFLTFLRGNPFLEQIMEKGCSSQVSADKVWETCLLTRSLDQVKRESASKRRLNAAPTHHKRTQTHTRTHTTGDLGGTENYEGKSLFNQATLANLKYLHSVVCNAWHTLANFRLRNSPWCHHIISYVNIVLKPTRKCTFQEIYSGN